MDLLKNTTVFFPSEGKPFAIKDYAKMIHRPPISRVGNISELVHLIVELNFHLSANAKVPKGHFSPATHKPRFKELETVVTQLSGVKYSRGVKSNYRNIGF